MSIDAKELHKFERRSEAEIRDEILQILSLINANESQKRAVMNVPGRYRLQYARSLNPASGKALALKMKCYDCVGFESVSDRVSNCTCRLCPLWNHRPFQSNDSASSSTNDDED
jgi:hypothetical protein